MRIRSNSSAQRHCRRDRRSKYASLPAVPAHRRRPALVPEGRRGARRPCLRRVDQACAAVQVAGVEQLPAAAPERNRDRPGSAPGRRRPVARPRRTNGPRRARPGPGGKPTVPACPATAGRLCRPTRVAACRRCASGDTGRTPDRAVAAGSRSVRRRQGRRHAGHRRHDSLGDFTPLQCRRPSAARRRKAEPPVRDCAGFAGRPGRPVVAVVEGTCRRIESQQGIVAQQQVQARRDHEAVLGKPDRGPEQPLPLQFAMPPMRSLQHRNQTGDARPPFPVASIPQNPPGFRRRALQSRRWRHGARSRVRPRPIPGGGPDPSAAGSRRRLCPKIAARPD
jgi:hypothetical protein